MPKMPRNAKEGKAPNKSAVGAKPGGPKKGSPAMNLKKHPSKPGKA